LGCESVKNELIERLHGSSIYIELLEEVPCDDGRPKYDEQTPGKVQNRLKGKLKKPTLLEPDARLKAIC